MLSTEAFWGLPDNMGVCGPEQRSQTIIKATLFTNPLNNVQTMNYHEHYVYSSLLKRISKLSVLSRHPSPV
jgi:hypothetical protein